MTGRFWPIVNTAVFTIVVPGIVAILIPHLLLGGNAIPRSGFSSVAAASVISLGALIYFRCA